MKHDTEKNKKRVLTILEENLGIVSKTCEQAGISRVTFYGWCKVDPDFKKAVDELDNVTLDFVESKLLEKINEGDTRAIGFYLKYKGRKRGYIESLKLDQEHTGSINVVIKYEDKINESK